jgi:hypothetical protein
MGKQTLKQKLVGFIGHIGWRIFCWSYTGGEKQYLDDVQKEALNWPQTSERKSPLHLYD